ncbi:MAG: DUF4091 domain-containing protein [Paludibacteraceae bacterium]|nr:DUF4091 domain-containing protein [Paludibacteraceae bacterium]
MRIHKLIIISLFSAFSLLAIAQQKSKNPNESAGFVSSDIRFEKNDIQNPDFRKSDTLVAWKGEKVHTQILFRANAEVKALKVHTADLKSEKGGKISRKNIQTGFQSFVITDEFGNGCGHRKPADFDSSWVADPINFKIKKLNVAQNDYQPLWVSVTVPQNAKAGIYKTIIRVNGNTKHMLSLVLRVVDKVLPEPSQWTFNLDFWQHPAAIARVHGVELWSKKHFNLMRPYYEMLAGAGQKNITASIVHEPWGHQTYDDFPSLVQWTKKSDGSWQYDYGLFDKYISFVMDCGIDQRINCYSMVPWKIAFRYYDEESAAYREFASKIGSPEYNEFWGNMLADFTKHLKQKGWFDKAVIAMDERPMKALQDVIALLKTIDPAWKVALAGDYHAEIEADIFDYCVASRWQFPATVLERRRSEGKLSTWYTCCTERYPNGFTFSPPAEHVWTGIYTAAKDMDGFLRWAYNSWPAQPLRDSRFTAWPAGDTFQVYPGPLNSIRFEKIIEGIQDFEKIQILRELYKNDPAKLAQLEEILEKFHIQKLSKQPAADMIRDIKLFLNN